MLRWEGLSAHVLIPHLLSHFIRQPFAECFHLAHHVLCPGRPFIRFAQREQRLEKVGGHFIDGHIFRPQVNAQGAAIGCVPYREVEGFAFFLRLTGFARLPGDALRDFIRVQLDVDADFGSVVHRVCFKVESGRAFSFVLVSKNKITKGKRKPFMYLVIFVR